MIAYRLRLTSETPNPIHDIALVNESFPRLISEAEAAISDGLPEGWYAKIEEMPEYTEVWCVLLDTTAPWPEVVFAGTREKALEYQREVTDYETSVQRVQHHEP